MIAMSRRCRRLVVALLALSAPGCALVPRECSTIGCLDGLNIALTGAFAPETTYAIDISRLTPTGQAVSVMSCARTHTLNSGEQITCTSAASFRVTPVGIQITDYSLTKVRVAISRDGTLVGQRDYDVIFSTREINGKGCGECTTARIDVDFPAGPV